MERIDEFRNALLVHISELNIEPMVKSLSLHPEELPDMYKLTFDNKLLVSWRALWVCEKLSEVHPITGRTDRTLVELYTRRFKTSASFHSLQSSGTGTHICSSAEFLFRPYVLPR